MANRCERHRLGAGDDGLCVICRRELSSSNASSTPVARDPNVLVHNIVIFTLAGLGLLVYVRDFSQNYGAMRAQATNQLQAASEPRTPDSVPTDANAATGQQALAAIPITVYETQGCPWCRKAKAWFRSKQLTVTTFDIDRSERAASEMRRLNPEGGVPTIVIEAEVIVGFDQRKIEQTLAAIAARHAGEKVTLKMR